MTMTGDGIASAKDDGDVMLRRGTDYYLPIWGNWIGDRDGVLVDNSPL